MFRNFLFSILILTAQLSSAQNLFEYELAHIKFEGNKEFSSSELKELIFSKETPYFLWKFVNSIISKYGSPAVYFDSSYIRHDVNALREFYKAYGFFEAEFDYSYEADTSRKEVTLFYKIKENDQFLTSETHFWGLDSIPYYIRDEILEDYSFDSTDKYRQPVVEENINNLLTFFYNHGYKNAVYDSSLVFVDTADNQVDLDLYFSPGDRYRISEIIVEKKGDGEKHVSDLLIKELIAISPDEYYNLEKIKLSQSRLSRTGLFTSLRLAGGKSDSTKQYIPLRFEGNIGNMNELSPEIVMDNELNSFNLGLGGNFVRKNFLGEAKKLTLGTKVGVVDVFHFNFNNLLVSPSNRDSTFQGYMELSLRLEQPYVFNRPILGSLEGYFKTITLQQSNENKYGSKLGFEFEMPEHTFVNQLKVYYNLESYELSTSFFDPFRLLFNSLTNLIGAEFASIKTNDIFYPSVGTNLAFLLEGGISNSRIQIPGGYFDLDSAQFGTGNMDIDIDARAVFYKAQFTSTNFFPLDYNHTAVFGIKTRIGYIQTVYGGDEFIPPNRLFTAGGSNSVRGWRARQLIPVNPISSLYITENDNTIGGSFLLEGSFEYRKRIFENVGIAFFTDYANLQNGYKTFRFDQFAAAVGFGFRYYSSIAPFRVDLGFRLYDPANKKFIYQIPPFKTVELHFGIGEAF